MASTTTKFIAAKGVQFADLGIQFSYDREATGSGSSRVYSAELNSADAAALQKLPKAVLAEYGIEKAKADSTDD
ncbi:hypothetical protein [Nocardioides sp.]|uniref:hypothetical protein n=1 Tax=Nocardioides sp. TaxID=35761 RepID=UPI003514BA3D